MIPDLDRIPDLNRRFEGAAPEVILHWAAETFGEHLAIVTSFQPSGLVMLHMLLTIAPHTPVLTLDTGQLFPQTYALIDRWERCFPINLVRIKPAQSLEEQAEQYGMDLWQRDPDLCCQLRKTIPLTHALSRYQAWITGIRRDQASTRSQSPIVAWDAKHNNLKLAPLAAWTEAEVWAYIHAHELPYNPLHDQGYASIGCQPCTRAILPGEDKRAGRWSGYGKVECGIHTGDLASDEREL